jgi:polyisoprenoid-binding protein YceI
MGLWHWFAAAAIIAVVGSALYLVRADEWVRAGVRAALRRPATWLVGVPTLMFVLLVGVPFAYVRSIATTAPPPLSFADLALPTTSPTSTATTETVPGAPSSTAVPGTTASVTTTRQVALHESTAPETTLAPEIAGAWAVGHGTQARYNVDDTALGQTATVVGSTSDVAGTMQIVDTTVTAASVVVNMQTVRCSCVHDDKYRDMLDVDVYPTSTFELTSPISLAAIPGEGEVINVPVTGTFTIHGVTRQVTFALAALRQAGRIAINGKIPVKLEDFNIENPNAGALGGLSNCFIDLLIAFDRTG